MVIQDSLPIFFPDVVSLAFCLSFVNEGRSFVECGTEWFKSFVILEHYYPFLESVNLITDFISSVVKEYYFVDFIKLIEKNRSFLLLSWLQSTKEINHEYFIFIVTPCVEAVFIIGDNWTLLDA
jgi:hypothetical protein